jgi:hypothetical protein
MFLAWVPDQLSIKIMWRPLWQMSLRGSFGFWDDLKFGGGISRFISFVAWFGCRGLSLDLLLAREFDPLTPQFCVPMCAESMV